MQLPLKHHYLPVFYLKRWVDADGKICEFSRPYKEIYRKRVFPVQTGFVDRLYEMKGVPPAAAQQMEEEFMKPIDTLAARALAMLERGNARINYDAKYRSAWSLFLMTLLMRMPEDLVTLNEALAFEWVKEVPQIDAEYLTTRRSDDPLTLQDFVKEHDPDHMVRWTLDVARLLMDHAGIGQLLNNMFWFVLNFAGAGSFLLTSDRPVLMSATLTEHQAYVFLPIGPERLFVAVNDSETGQMIRERQALDLIEATNDLIAGHAKKYVYGQTDEPREFVKQHIFKRPQTSLMEGLASFRKRASDLQGGERSEARG